MSLELFNIISNNPAIDHFLKNEGRLVQQDPLAASFLVCSAYLKEKKNYTIITNNLYTAQTIYETISSILGEENCLLFPMDEIFHQTNYTYSKEMLAQRLFVMHKCLQNENKILITHVNAATRYLPNPELYKENILHFELGKSYSIPQTIQKLVQMSFTRVNKIDQPLQFAIRGDILDIFPINKERPIRIEFFDDEIESIRFFDIVQQTSNEIISSIDIFPSTDLLCLEEQLKIGKERLLQQLEHEEKELPFELRTTLKNKINQDLEDIETNGFNENYYKYFSYFQKETYTILDYFKSDITLLYQMDEISLSLSTYENETSLYLDELFKNGLSLRRLHLNSSLETITKKSNTTIPSYSFYKSDSDDYFLDIKTIPFFSRSLLNALTLIQEYQQKGQKAVICLSGQFYQNFISFLHEQGIGINEISLNQPPKENLSICQFDLETGFELPQEKLVFFSKKEIFGYKLNINIFSSRYKKAIILNRFEELQEGDYIVHEENGIGKYEGIVTLTANGQLGDYLKIRYANDQILYVPLQKFSTIRKYVSREGAVPRLSRIGGKDWSNTKAKIKEQVHFLADRLINLYAKRESTPGFAFKEDDEFQQQFETSFPYPLTKDQEKAVEDIKSDMEKPTPMDRLLCGDVGFGKTEVAFRAAFKAILSGKQVALLCPTTILAKQHFDVASSRFATFGVKIALFSRFISEARQKEYIKQIQENKIHLIIGTHRLLSKEISIPNLGLLIVDEEQRFGVEHKERIKELSTQVDVLTLTATPIPRTLQMSLLGIRNLSQLQTPPSSRMPIQTYVIPYEFRLAKEVISRELSRGGQIYYIYNQISTIARKAKDLTQAFPNAKIGMVHAKMDKDDIDNIMTKFYLNEIQILVCTSIVESGLDVPNANTIIIENADLFGLSQLYQIKGRVGRSNRVAYAYLFYNDKKGLTDKAEKRLNAIKEFTELGDGIKIAQKDLNIRGAGDILGAEQSGFIDTIGMDMYVSILEEVMNQKRGVITKEKRIKPTSISIGGYIPSSYALDSDKIQLYQEIEDCQTLAAIEVLRRRVRDIYGRLPKEVEQILLKRKIDILSNSPNIESIIEEETITITLSKEISKKDGVAKVLNQKMSTLTGNVKVLFHQKQFIFKIPKDKKEIDTLIAVLSILQNL